jgi:hypothetical protein
MALSERMDDGGRWLPTDPVDEPWVFSATVPDASVLSGEGLPPRRSSWAGRSSVDVALLFAVVVLMLGAVVVAVNLFQRV